MKKTFRVGVIVIICVISTLVVFLISQNYSAIKFNKYYTVGSPEHDIQQYIIKTGGKVDAAKFTINQTNFTDPQYGQLFKVEGYFDKQTDGQIMFFYLNNSKIDGWHVVTAGTGP